MIDLTKMMEEYEIIIISPKMHAKVKATDPYQMKKEVILDSIEELFKYIRDMPRLSSNTSERRIKETEQ